MYSNSEESVRPALGLAQAHSHRALPAAARHPCTIAISRQAGTPGSLLAEDLGRRLGWPVYDRLLLEKVAADLGLRADVLDSVDEKSKGWFTESIEALTTGQSINESAFVHGVVKALLSLASRGHCVVVGRGSVHVLPAATTLRVRLIASRDDRILNAQHTRQMTLDEAARWIDDTDKQRSAFIREHFLRDILDPGWYDVILNSSHWSVSQCAEIVIAALKQKENPA